MVDHSAHAMPKPGVGNERALKISAWLTGIYFLIELGIGLYSGSIAVISDAFHTFSAVGGVVLAFVAARIARRPADLDRTFGHYRAEIIGALLNGAFLAAMAVLVLVMGAMRLKHPIELPTTPMLIAAAGGIVTEVDLAPAAVRRPEGRPQPAWRLLARHADLRRQHPHHHRRRRDLFHRLLCPSIRLLGMAFGVVLLVASWGIIRDSLFILMEGAPQGDRSLGRCPSLGPDFRT